MLTILVAAILSILIYFRQPDLGPRVYRAYWFSDFPIPMRVFQSFDKIRHVHNVRVILVFERRIIATFNASRDNDGDHNASRKVFTERISRFAQPECFSLKHSPATSMFELCARQLAHDSFIRREMFRVVANFDAKSHVPRAPRLHEHYVSAHRKTFKRSHIHD